MELFGSNPWIYSISGLYSRRFKLNSIKFKLKIKWLKYFKIKSSYLKILFLQKIFYYFKFSIFYFIFHFIFNIHKLKIKYAVYYLLLKIIFSPQPVWEPLSYISFKLPRYSDNTIIIQSSWLFFSHTPLPQKNCSQPRRPILFLATDYFLYFLSDIRSTRSRFPEASKARGERVSFTKAWLACCVQIAWITCSLCTRESGILKYVIQGVRD